MNLEPAPRLPKLPFFVGDAVLLLTAALLAWLSPRPLGADTVVIIAVLVVLGAALFITPFIVAYAADTAEAVERERERVNEQVSRLHTATESLARAAAQIKSVEEAVHKSAREAETLPYRMQEKLAEFNESLSAREESDREALENELEELRAANSDQLKAVAEKIAKAAADWTALEAATRKQLTTAEAALAKLQAGSAEISAKLDQQLVSAAHTAAGTKTATPRTQSVEVVPLDPAPASALAEESAVAPTSTESVVPAVEASAETESPKPKKARAPRKPKAEDTLLAMSETKPQEPATNGTSLEPDASAPAPLTSIDATPAPNAEAPADETEGSASAAAPAESSSSSDGATRLLATAYIGIGNKLFIRGDGPGLSWDQGVPMQFVSIGKWGWSTHDAAGPVRCKLYKNDESAALTGEVVLEAGRHTEVTALF
jgi:chemotaxis protein histidine kinase CheA